ncbi:MAG: NAD-dependent epimerase/dehydratase family protein, partial [Pseudomonadota bacterium]
MPKTVLLTGITGFIAKRIAYDLLKAGHRVVGSVRTPGREDEVRAAVMSEGDADAAERLRFVTLDLNTDAGWAEAMAGIDVLIHTASPFPLSNPKDESEIIRPAVDGTMRALKAAQETGVRRVILTSSVVTIMHVDRPEGHLYGPEDWTDIGHPTASA